MIKSSTHINHRVFSTAHFKVPVDCRDDTECCPWHKYGDFDVVLYFESWNLHYHWNHEDDDNCRNVEIPKDLKGKFIRTSAIWRKISLNLRCDTRTRSKFRWYRSLVKRARFRTNRMWESSHSRAPIGSKKYDKTTRGTCRLESTPKVLRLWAYQRNEREFSEKRCRSPKVRWTKTVQICATICWPIDDKNNIEI